MLLNRGALVNHGLLWWRSRQGPPHKERPRGEKWGVSNSLWRGTQDVVWAIGQERLVGVKLGRDLESRQGNVDFPGAMRRYRRI